MQSDKAFDGFLRMVIRALEEAVNETDQMKKREKLEALLEDLQDTLDE